MPKVTGNTIAEKVGYVVKVNDYIYASFFFPGKENFVPMVRTHFSKAKADQFIKLVMEGEFGKREKPKPEPVATDEDEQAAG